MKTASSSATPASMKNQIIVYCFRRLFLAVLAVLGAACTTPPAPPSRPGLESTRAILKSVSYTELPGWRDDTLVEAWPAFLTGCAKLLAQPVAATIWREACSAAITVDAHDSPAVRTFFEGYLTAYRAEAPDGAQTGLVTGY